MQGRVLSGTGQWRAVAGAWRELRRDRPVDDIAHLEEWAQAVSQHDPASRWVVAEDADGPVAVLHGVLRRKAAAGVGVRTLTNGAADGVLAERCAPGALRTELLRAFAAAHEPLGAVLLTRVRPSDAYHRAAAGWPTPLEAEWRFGGYSLIDTGLAPDVWLEAAGKNLRASLRKARNRAAKVGEVRVEVASTPDAVARALDAYIAVEAAGWKGTSGALANRPVDRAALRSFLVAGAATGRARVRTLLIGGEVAAAQLCAVAGEVLVLLKVAYDESRASLAPGNLLMADLVADCCADPTVARIDLVTNQPWHDRWHPTRHPTFMARDTNARTVAGVVGGTALRLGRLASTLRDRPRARSRPQAHLS